MKGRGRDCFSALTWLFTLLVGASVTLTSPAQAAGGAGIREERAVVPLEFTSFKASLEVGSVSLLEAKDADLVMVRAERPGDQLNIEVTPKFTPIICMGDGSEVRFGGTGVIGDLSIAAEGDGRLCFRNAEQGWVYLCGRGQVEYADGKVVEFGANRTVDSCLDLLSSPDAILREGGARDLGRLTGDADAIRVVPRLAALLNDTVPFVRRGAAEGLGLIGRQECVLWLKAAAATEQEELTGKYIAEALALCGGNVLIADPNAPELSGSEAAKLYLEGRTRWSNDMLAHDIQARSPAAAQALMAHLDSAEADVRLAAVYLLRAAKCAEARQALTKLSTDDPDEQVRAAAKEAVEERR